MPTLAHSAAVLALAAMDVELSHDGPAGNLGLVLRLDMGFLHVAAAARAGVGQGDLVDLVDAIRRRRLAMAMSAMAFAAFASGFFGFLLRRSFGEGRRLSLGGPLTLLEQALGLFEQLRELLDLGLQRCDFLA